MLAVAVEITDDIDRYDDFLDRFMPLRPGYRHIAVPEADYALARIAATAPAVTV